ncbi:Uncharacterized protein TCM_036781 [Theobroma cacao]|uniref:Uncharacterized protein n=1 Tax=Theobroma cacao TaxID=3641 RepID=A0A061GHX1_THECC|nr:Uncharacterized protein TCM_036781 [Theobroma cacao]
MNQKSINIQSNYRCLQRKITSKKKKKKKQKVVIRELLIASEVSFLSPFVIISNTIGDQKRYHSALVYNFMIAAAWLASLAREWLANHPRNYLFYGPTGHHLSQLNHSRFVTIKS